MIAPVAYSAAFLSSVCFGLASVLEQIGTKRVKTLDSINPADFLPLLKQTPYTAGLALDGIGFITFLVAVHALPLFFVQAVGTASIAVTALASRYTMKVRLTFKEYRLMAILLGGLVLLSYVAAPETAAPVSIGFRYGLIGAAAIMIMVSLAVSRRAKQRPHFIAMLSGLSFSGVAVASRILPANLHLLTQSANPLVIAALVIYGGLGLLLFSMAIQNGEVTHVYAITFVTETVIPATIGIWFLGDSPRDGLWLVMLVGLIVTVASTSALALSKDYSGHA